MKDFQCFNYLLVLLWVVNMRYVGSEENRNQNNEVGATKTINEIENYKDQNVFKEDTSNKTLLTCNSNEWICKGKCIHKREYCVENSQCHPTYPIPCGDKVRCYRQVYISIPFLPHSSNVVLLKESPDRWIEYII